MARKFIADMKENEHVENVFFVSDKVVGVGKTGKTYLSLKLADKTGMLDAKIWDKVDYLNAQFEREEFVRIKGNLQTYQGGFQLVVTDIRRAAEGEFELDDFVPESGKDTEQMWQELVSIGEGFSDQAIKDLFKKIFIDDAEFQARFKVYPAAKSLHHAYKGGLLEHSLNVAKLADLMCSFYEGQFDRDLLVFTALAHDIGKVRELSYSFSVNYSDEGKLLGHIMLADEMLVSKAGELEDFPPKQLMLLRHIIISHHGELEFGSPKRPKTGEALIIHLLDNLDAKLNSFHLSVGRDLQTGDWTSMIRNFDRQLYKGSKGTQNRGVSAAEPKPGNVAVEADRKTESGKEKTFNPLFKNIDFGQIKN